MLKEKDNQKKDLINLKKKNIEKNNIENRQLLIKITSKYILKGIFDYTDENEDFKLNLLIHSNTFQKKLDINIYKYQEKYFKNIGLDLIKYFSFIYNSDKKFYIFLLEDEFEKDLSNLNINKNIIKKYIKNNFKGITLKKEYKKLLPGEYNDIIQVDILSPFFDILLENGLLEFCSIIIQTKLIEGYYKLKEDFICIFDKLNKSNLKYTALTLKLNNNDDINYLKEFKINFGQIKTLIFLEEDSCGIMSHDYFFNTLFSFESIINNLVVLIIRIKINYFTEYIDPNTLENLNKFKSLKTLILENFQLENIFLFKLQNLEILKLINCDIILFDENIGLNMKELSLLKCSIEKPKKLLQLPELISLELISLQEQKSYNIIDYSSMKKLKKLNIDSKDFIYIDNSPLEDIILNPYNKISFLSEKKIIEKIFSFKELKKLYLPIINIDSKNIKQITSENNSLTSLEINLKNQSNNCNLLNIEKKFKKIVELIINQDFVINNSNEINLEIIDNPKCKINKLRLNNINTSLKLYCGQFNKLVEIDININNKINILNLKESIPIFGYKCKTIFSNLKTFHFVLANNITLKIDILYNIYNNLDKMPILQNIILDFNVEMFDKDIYKRLINKLFSMKLIGYIKIGEENKVILIKANRKKI